jgi:hypothetical protein
VSVHQQIVSNDFPFLRTRRAKAGKNSNEGKGRWKTAINLSDQTVEFLTDSDYLGQLQGKIQKKSIDILYERLAERKVTPSTDFL